MRDSASKSNWSWCGPPTDSFRLLRLPAGLRVAERRAQDVGQLQHQPAQIGVEAARLGVLRGVPGVRDQARRHVVRAAEHLAVGAQRAAGVAEHLLERLAFARAELGGRHRPQLGQRAAGAVVHRAADLVFELQRVAAQALALDAARRHVRAARASTTLDSERTNSGPPTRSSSTSGKSWRSAARSRYGASRAGRRSRPSIGAQAVALAPAGEVEDQLVLLLACMSITSSLSVQRAGACGASSSGHTVYLSSSRFRPARMYSGERSWPAWRRSS